MIYNQFLHLLQLNILYFKYFLFKKLNKSHQNLKINYKYPQSNNKNRLLIAVNLFLKFFKHFLFLILKLYYNHCLFIKKPINIIKYFFDYFLDKKETDKKKDYQDQLLIFNFSKNSSNSNTFFLFFMQINLYDFQKTIFIKNLYNFIFFFIIQLFLFLNLY